MDKNRVDTVAYDIIRSVREVMIRHDVSHAEYLAAQRFLVSFLKAPEYEIPLAVDIFFDATVHDVEMKVRKGSRTNTQGPFFKADCPTVESELKTLPGRGEPFRIEGAVTDLDGRPIVGAELFVWHSDPDGFYSGFSEHMPENDYYRGRVIVPESGQYSLASTLPEPYRIPHDGPTGHLLKAMGRHPWRPAHVHFMINADGFEQHITQAYFVGGRYNDEDCASSVRPELLHQIDKVNGVWVLRKDFRLDRIPSH